jgi:hypothetical protein
LGAHISRISEENPEKLPFFEVYDSPKTNSIQSQKKTAAPLLFALAFHPLLAVHRLPPAAVILVTMVPLPSSL